MPLYVTTAAADNVELSLWEQELNTLKDFLLALEVTIMPISLHLSSSCTKKQTKREENHLMEDKKKKKQEEKKKKDAPKKVRSKKQ